MSEASRSLTARVFSKAVSCPAATDLPDRPSPTDSRHRRLLCRVVLFTLFLLQAPISTALASSQEQLPDVLHLNVSNSGYPPYLIVDDNGQPGGLAYETITRIAERLGIEVIVHRIPRKRVDELLLEGHIDATPRAREWTEDPGQFLFTDAIIDVQEVFFTRADSELEFSQVADLPPMQVVTPLGYFYPSLDELFQQGHLERFEVASDRDIFVYLRHNTDFDAAIADLTVGQWILRQNGWKQDFRHSRNSISRFGYRLMLRPDWQPFAEAFNRELEALRTSGELDRILDNYR